MATATVRNKSEGKKIVKRMMFLAWQACGGPAGMGFFQDRGHNQTEDEVWDAMYNQTDYPGAQKNPSLANKPQDVRADYVMGRMMKLSLRWDDKSITTPNANWRSDYQAFCRKYPNFEALHSAAVKSLEEAKENQ